MKVAVTGSRGFRKGEEGFAHDLIQRTLVRGDVRGVSEFRTGAQWGVDTQAAHLALALFPRARHVVFVPHAPHNESVVEVVENALGVRSTQVVNCADAGDDAKSYRLRNHMMIEGAELLLAFPSTRQELNRSGTWMTIRMARISEIPVLITPLDGSPSWRESAVPA